MKLSILTQSVIRRHLRGRQENSAERRGSSFKIVELLAQCTETLIVEGKFELFMSLADLPRYFAVDFGIARRIKLPNQSGFASPSRYAFRDSTEELTRKLL
jgi:hypothetical protein